MKGLPPRIILMDEPHESVPSKPDKEFHIAYFIGPDTLSGVNVTAPDIAQAVSKACVEHQVILDRIGYVAEIGLRVNIAK